MALGTVRTAKGKWMDFAELSRRSRKPIHSSADLKDTVQRQKPLPRKLVARGHMPTHVGVKKPDAVAPAPTTVTRQIEAKSLTDYTGITIDEPKHLKERPADPVATANEALTKIMGDMDKYRGRPAAKIPKKA